MHETTALCNEIAFPAQGANFVGKPFIKEARVGLGFGLPTSGKTWVVGDATPVDPVEHPISARESSK